MKTLFNNESATPADAPAPGGPRGTQAGFRARLRSARQACRQVFGIPDYERYIAHMAAEHPGDPVLSQRDFFAQSIDRKYGKSGPRCC